MIAVILSQHLRIQKAVRYLESRLDGSRAVIFTSSTVGPAIQLPIGVDVALVGTQGAGRSSARRLPSGLQSRLAASASSGSPLAATVSKWIKSADWKMRYARRLLAVIENAGSSTAFVTAERLIDEMNARVEDSGYSEIAVFDVFDLGVAVEAGERFGCRVIVR